VCFTTAYYSSASFPDTRHFAVLIRIFIIPYWSCEIDMLTSCKFCEQSSMSWLSAVSFVAFI